MRPENYVCMSSFFSNWGDRMWTFAVALYLVKITPGSLQLAATFGLVLSFSAVLFSPMVGDWIDRNSRLMVVRMLLFLQNLLVILCALLILMYLYNITEKESLKLLLQALIIITGSCANLAGQGEKIAISKDWIVVICKGSKELLATTNALIRRIDLTVAILSPIAVGLLMSLISNVAGIIFICSWNIVSMIAEYLLLLKVYHAVPELANKLPKFVQSVAQEEEEGDDEVFVERSIKGWNVLQRFKTVLLGWKIYKRQNVFLAGFALSMLYLTVIGFGAITLGYAYIQGLSELYVSLSLALGSLFGVFGTFLFPLIRGRIGLAKTGIVGFFMQWTVLLLCVVSIWLPGSPSNLYNDAEPGLTTTAKTIMFNSTLNSTLSTISTTKDGKSMISILFLMMGIILSRTGLWISDLTITQLYQENVIEEERGVVGGVQYSFNCILDLLRFAMTIVFYRNDQFGGLILMSFSAVAISGIIYAIFLAKFHEVIPENENKELSEPAAENIL